MNKRLCFALAALMALPGAVLAQEKPQAQSTPPANPITTSNKGLYSFVSGAVVGGAQKSERRSIKAWRDGGRAGPRCARRR